MSIWTPFGFQTEFKHFFDGHAPKEYREALARKDMNLCYRIKHEAHKQFALKMTEDPSYFEKIRSADQQRARQGMPWRGNYMG